MVLAARLKQSTICCLVAISAGKHYNVNPDPGPHQEGEKVNTNKIFNKPFPNFTAKKRNNNEIISILKQFLFGFYLLSFTSLPQNVDPDPKH